MSRNYYFCNHDSDSDSDCDCACKGEKGSKGDIGPIGPKGDSDGDLEFWDEEAGTNAAGVPFSLFRPKKLGNIRFAAMTVEDGAGFTLNRTVAASDRAQPMGVAAVDLQLNSTDGRTAFGPNSAILSGAENRTGQHRSVVVGGEFNFVEGALSGIGWGDLHRIESAPGSNFALNSGIGWGSENEIRAGANPATEASTNHCSIVGGLRNKIHALSSNANANYSAIGGGNDNRIEIEAALPGFLGSAHVTGSVITARGIDPDTILDLTFCSINSGETNTITNSGRAFGVHHSNIHGGAHNIIRAGEINGAQHANIVGGFGNIVSANYGRVFGNYNAITPNLVPKASPSGMKKSFRSESPLDPDSVLSAYMLATFGNQTQVRNLASTTLGYNGDDDTEIIKTALEPFGRVALANGTARAKRTTHLFGLGRSVVGPNGRFGGSAALAATDVFASNRAGGLATYMKFADEIPPEIIAQPYGWIVTVTAGGIRLAVKGDFVSGVTTAPAVGVVTDTQILDGDLYEVDNYGVPIVDATYLDGVFDFLQTSENIDEIKAFALTNDTPNIALALGEAGLVTTETALYLNQFIYENYAVRKRAQPPETLARTLDPQWVPMTSWGPARTNCASNPPPFVGERVVPSGVPGVVEEAGPGEIGWAVLKIVDPGGPGKLAVIIVNFQPPAPF